MSRHEPPETADKDSESLDEHAVGRYEADNSSAIAVRSLDDVKRLSLIFIGSGMFASDNGGMSEEQQMYQAGVKIIAGVEFGIQPFAAMRGINLIKGKAEMSANLMAAKVKAHPKYDYTVEQLDRDGCRLIFWEIPYPRAPRSEWAKLGPSDFNAEDARLAGLSTGKNADTWRKFARNMYFARAISNGVRIYTPDVFYGAPVYVEGEISGEFEAQPQESAKEAEPETPAPTPTPKPDPVEAEIVGDESIDPLEHIRMEISDLADELDYSRDWFVSVSLKIKTVDDAEAVLAQLRQKQIEKMMDGDD